MEGQPKDSVELMDANARQLARLCGSLASLGSSVQLESGSLRTADSSHMRVFEENGDRLQMPDDPAAYSEVLDSLGLAPVSYQSLLQDRQAHQRNAKRYQDFLENQGQGNTTVRNDDIRS